MNLEQILGLMTLLGGFGFISMGLCVANSIEDKESEKVANVLTIIMVASMVSFLIGIIGLIIYGIVS